MPLRSWCFILSSLMSKKSQISSDDIRHLATLSRLIVSDQDIAKLETQLGDILGYVERLKEIPIEGVEPLSHVHGSVNVFRHDIVQESSSEEILKGAPATSGTYIKTPIIVDPGE